MRNNSAKRQMVIYGKIIYNTGDTRWQPETPSDDTLGPLKNFQ